MSLKDKLDLNKDGKLDTKDIQEASKRLPKWKLVIYIILLGLFMIGTNFGPVLLDILLK